MHLFLFILFYFFNIFFIIIQVQFSAWRGEGIIGGKGEGVASLSFISYLNTSLPCQLLAHGCLCLIIQILA